MRFVFAGAASVAAVMLFMTFGMVVALGGNGPRGDQESGRVADIPPDYLELYRGAATATALDWSVLAAIGKVETDHGRSTAPGVRSGVNSYGCCAGPMQFSIVGSPSTWDSYGKGGDVYDPADAIPAAARYLLASGAPEDYHRAILAYNHSEAYYRDVVSQARAYRRAATRSNDDDGSLQGGEVGEAGPDWLARVPGTALECDRRIVADVVLLTERYHLLVTACYAPTGHASAGEHPLGLAIDAVPAPPSTWDALDRLAHDAGWRTSCASSGCASQTHTVFRFVGWDGYPGHGRGDHIHLSWNHGTGVPASSVQVLNRG